MTVGMHPYLLWGSHTFIHICSLDKYVTMIGESNTHRVQCRAPLVLLSKAYNSATPLVLLIRAKKYFNLLSNTLTQPCQCMILLFLTIKNILFKCCKCSYYFSLFLNKFLKYIKCCLRICSGQPKH